MAGVGAALALWPFIAALGPTADQRARRVVFNLADLQGNAPSRVNAGGRAVMIFRRTPEELALIRNPPEPLPERALQETRERADAKNWHRSLRPGIAVMTALCTHGDCIVTRVAVSEPELMCPCCGARYDLAGRVLGGPAPTNLPIPPYAFVGENEIEFLELT